MNMSKVLLIGIAGLLLSACNIEKREAEQMVEFDQLVQNFKLTPKETATAKHAIAGFKIDLGRSVLPDREIRQAICYATSVEMPARLDEAHALYLKNYREIDRDYLNWFASKGINQEDAREMGGIYLTAHNACKKTQGRLRNMKMLKARG